ncbi:MAG: MBL fold metallo-hydrolase, partial [Lysobacterales bacterium]
MPRKNPSEAMPFQLCLFFCLFALPFGALSQEKKVEFIATPLSGTVTMLTGSGGNVGISAGEDGVYIVDDQVKPITDQLLEAIRKVSDKPIRFVINTHYHGDHAGGNELIGGTGAIIIAHENVYRRMSTEQFSKFMKESTAPWPAGALPVITFSDQATLHLNGEAATVYHVANGHTDGDAIVHFPVSNVIHMGDIYFNGLYPFIDLDAGGTLQGMLEAVNFALRLTNEDTRIIPGHGPLATANDLIAYRDFLVQSRDRVQILIDQDKSLEETIAATPTAQWDAALGQ